MRRVAATGFPCAACVARTIDRTSGTRCDPGCSACSSLSGSSDACTLRKPSSLRCAGLLPQVNDSGPGTGEPQVTTDPWGFRRPEPRRLNVAEECDEDWADKAWGRPLGGPARRAEGPWPGPSADRRHRLFAGPGRRKGQTPPNFREAPEVRALAPMSPKATRQPGLAGLYEVAAAGGHRMQVGPARAHLPRPGRPARGRPRTREEQAPRQTNRPSEETPRAQKPPELRGVKPRGVRLGGGGRRATGRRRPRPGRRRAAGRRRPSGDRARSGPARRRGRGRSNRRRYSLTSGGRAFALGEPAERTR